MRTLAIGMLSSLIALTTCLHVPRVVVHVFQIMSPFRFQSSNSTPRAPTWSSQINEKKGAVRTTDAVLN